MQFSTTCFASVCQTCVKLKQARTPPKSTPRSAWGFGQAQLAARETRWNSRLAGHPVALRTTIRLPCHSSCLAFVSCVPRDSSWAGVVGVPATQGRDGHRRQPFHLGDMTMKVLCISKWAKALSPEERDAILPKEVPATLKLYLAGVIEQMWFKLDAPGVVFLVNAESIDAAKTHVHGLPMGQAGLMDFDFIPVGPLAPLGMLIAEK